MNIKLLLPIVLLFCLIIRLFCGVFVDDEFAEEAFSSSTNLLGNGDFIHQ